MCVNWESSGKLLATGKTAEYAASVQVIIPVKVLSILLPFPDRDCILAAECFAPLL